MKLSDITIEKLSPLDKGQKQYIDDTLAGFGVRVSVSGAKTLVIAVGPERKSASADLVDTFAKLRISTPITIEGRSTPLSDTSPQSRGTANPHILVSTPLEEGHHPRRRTRLVQPMRFGAILPQFMGRSMVYSQIGVNHRETYDDRCRDPWAYP